MSFTPEDNAPDHQPVAPTNPDAGRVLIVDDEAINIRITSKYLKAAGIDDVIGLTDPAAALRTINDQQPDVVLLDVIMPGISGLQLLRQVRDNEQTADLPVLILTADDNAESRKTALECGATDFLAKPVDASELIPRVRNTIAAKKSQDALKAYAQDLEQQVTRRTAEIERTRREVVHCLARAAEFRDNETGRHILRVGRYSAAIARQMGMPDNFVELIELAAPLHDVGKIGIPDEILLKPGKLTEEEFNIMKTHAAKGRRVFETMPHEHMLTLRQHTEVGSEIVGEPDFDLLKLAKSIALTHHEKYDGSGYPMGLAGEDIPIEGRIVAVADVFDALSSKRPYKDPFPKAKCFEILQEGRGQHFDPAVLDAFFAAQNEVVRAQIELADLDEAA